MFTAQKMKFSTKDFFGKCDQILNGKLTFLYSGSNPENQECYFNFFVIKLIELRNISLKGISISILNS